MRKHLNFFFENEFGELNQVHLGYQFPIFPIYDVNFKECSYRTKGLTGTQNIAWEYKGELIRLKSTSNIFAYPSVDLNFIIAVYSAISKEFFAPHNAVIYNLDGSVHKVLQMPKLISKRLLAEIEKGKHSNPPVETLKYDKSTGLNFSGCGWRKDEHGVLFNAISIQYNRDYGESRQLHPQTGEIGRLVDDWYNYY